MEVPEGMEMERMEVPRGMETEQRSYHEGCFRMVIRRVKNVLYGKVEDYMFQLDSACICAP